MARELGVGMIGYQFMGKVHSNAWLSAPRQFSLRMRPALRVICGRNERALKKMARQWGWQDTVTDYREMLQRDDVDLVDVSTPNNTHCEMAIAAAEAGKHVACEKPLAMNAAECKAMLKAVRKAGVKHAIWHNYRRIPAIALAKQMIDEGKIGEIRHWRGAYLQDWIVDPNFPNLWRMRKELCGSGAHGDLNAHLIDLARYLVGEIAEVVGMSETFIKQRPLPDGSGRMRRVTVDDAVLFLARFRNGAIGSFESTRMAPGRKNGWRIEVNGSEGSLFFSFEDMNYLDYYSLRDPKRERGFKRIILGDKTHPYAGGYYGAGHVLGYEHTFVNFVADIANCIAKDEEIVPNFVDGLRNQQVLDAALVSCQEHSWVPVAK